MISDNWPCVYWNETTQQFLIVYVDDMKLAGTLSEMEPTWALLSRGITLEEPKGNKDKVMTFLGCEHRRVERGIDTPNGKVTIQGVEWDVSHSMRRCVAKYEAAVHSITGMYPRIVHSDTPSIPGETKYARCRAPTRMKPSTSVLHVATAFPQA